MKKIIASLFLFAVILNITACSVNKKPPDIYIYEKPATSSATSSNNETSEPEPEEIILPVLPEYQDLYETNPDLVGWIQIKDTLINYPIFQTDNNQDYLEMDSDKNPSKKGSIFIDYKCNIKKSDNIIIYGHNLLSGEGFAGLSHYYPWMADSKGSLEYYKKHPVIIYNNIYEKSRNQYKIFAGIYTTADISDKYFFDYHKYPNFENEDVFYEYMANVMDRTVFYTDVDVKYGDEFLTLSTCMYLLGKNQDTRFVLFARKLRENESPYIDTNNASINADPLYFQKYYEIMGTEWHERNWPTNKITGYAEYLAKN